MAGLSYTERLTVLKLYSLQRRREIYIIIYVWKILEGLVPNLFPPICTKTSDRRGRTCISSHINVGRLGTLEYNSFRWCVIRLFNQLPLFVPNTTVCSILSFKKQLDSYLSTVPDSPCLPGFNNSLDHGDCLRWRTPHWNFFTLLIFNRAIMKSFGATFFYDRMPFLASTKCVGCSIKTVLNLIFQTKIQLIQLHNCVHSFYTKHQNNNYILSRPLVASYDIPG